MQNSEYTKIYSTLGVFQDDGWETVRAAYKRQIKRWHPDRFQNLDHRKIAEEKSKEINHAYQKLSDYYEKFGELPPDHIAEHTPADDARTQATQHPDPSPEYSYAYSDVSAQPKNRRGYISVVITGILLAIGYSLWEPEFFGEPDVHRIDIAEHPALGAEDGNPVLNQDANETDSPGAIPKSNDTNQTAGVHGSAWSTESTYKRKSPASPSSYKTAYDMEPATATTSSLPLLIKKGSSKKDVLAVQGPPERQTDSVWDYGVSRIYFQGDYVSSWHEHPMNPLSVAR